MGGLWSSARRGTETGAHARVGTKRPRPSWRPVAPVDRQKVPVSIPSATVREAGDGQRDAKRARRSELAVRTGPGSVPVVSAQPAEEPVMSSIDPTPDGGTHRYKVRCPALYWGNKKEVTRVLKRVKEFPPYQSVHKISKWDHFFISFPNAAAAADGVAKLALIYHKGDPWTASKVSAHTPRQIRVTAAMQQATKDGNTDKNGVCRTAADVTAPWRAVPYGEQLSRKRKLLDSALADITTAVWGERFAGGAVPWADALQSDRRRRDVPPCCDLESVFGAEGDLEDARSFYRNKNEFTIGFSPSSCGVGHTHHVREPTAGYSLGLVSTGEVRIGAITEDCISTSGISRQVATTMSDIVVRSKQTIYDKMAHVGYWRQVMCRHSDRTGTVIIVPMVSSRVQDDEGNIAPPEDAWSDERCREETWIAMQKLFEGTPYKIGLFWQVCDSLTAQSAETLVERLNGIEWLEEELMGLTFRVHPAAFFQVNTRMAEKLYQTIGELGCLQESSILLDICCGTGTIGLCLASRVHRVVGIEMCEPAILDARVNASRNGVTNSIFIAGRVEDKIRELLAHVPTSRECVAILDPPRAGVHSSVIIALRAVKAINRIVYVACEPKNLHRNALALCRPKSKVYGGVPFRPVRAVGVDLFPHTPCAELVVQFER
jgi:tRNA/tmRNA/rRNA uracil-C5-methylase (TrmA/RlmC/RlmD family)